MRRKDKELGWYRVIEWGGLFREIPAVSDQDQGEYDLADVPEPRQPKAPITPGKPLPRLWKTEPDEDEEEELKEAAEAKKKQEAAQSAKETVRSAEVRQRARKAKPKESNKPPGDEGSEKKVLVEETPARHLRGSPARAIDRGRANRRLHRNLRLDLLQAVHL